MQSPAPEHGAHATAAGGDVDRADQGTDAHRGGAEAEAGGGAAELAGEGPMVR
jgi:hypothetical protein